VPTATAADTATTAPTPTATPDQSALAVYAGTGAYVVGVTTLNIGDRDIEVWYPVDHGSETGKEKASYASFEVLPPEIQAILPPDLNIIVPMEAYRDLPVSAAGPFPVLTFSHGAGGFRQAYSGLLTGSAAHGYVVASLEHLEWGLLAQVGLLPPGTNRSAAEVLQASLDRLADANADDASPLAGGVDTTRVATAGHSAGGAAAFGLPDAPEVKAMLGFATGGSGRGVAGKAILLLAGARMPAPPGWKPRTTISRRSSASSRSTPRRTTASPTSAPSSTAATISSRGSWRWAFPFRRTCSRSPSTAVARRISRRRSSGRWSNTSPSPTSAQRSGRTIRRSGSAPASPTRSRRSRCAIATPTT
jgi:dienelactone hydrolase